MRFSSSTARILVAAVQFSIALGDPATTDDKDVLSIPVADVVNKNLASYQNHPLFKTYTDWVGTSEEAQNLIAKSNDPDVVSPYLVGIECYPDTPACFFTSRKKFEGSDEDWQALVDTLDESPTPTRLMKRIATDKWKVELHAKTYHRKGSEAASHGHEHYFNYNLKCKSLGYRSTGFQVVAWNVSRLGRTGPNEVASSVVAKEFHSKPFLEIHFRLKFKCTLLSGQCCLHDRKVWREDGGGWASPPTFECNHGSKAKADCR